MRAEIIAIGTELTTGAKLDTNSQWLSVELSSIGIPVHFHTTLADDLDANIAAFRIASERADLVLISGGLGPTLDDLTREALARMLGVELVLHQTSLAEIKAMFTRRNRDMPERNVIQAMFPSGAIPIQNRRGTAPGVWLEVDRVNRPPCLFAAMPGVPSEMKPMFREDVLPRLAGAGTSRVIRNARIHCFGLGESAAEELLGDVTARGRDPEVGITVHEATITLRIVSEAPSVEEAQGKIAATREVIQRRLGEYVFGEEEDEIEHVVIRQLLQRGQTLATCEDATAGQLASRLTHAAGSVGCYRGGLVAVPEESLGAMLGIDSTAIEGSVPHGAERAGQIAQATRNRFHADYSLAVTPRSRPGDRETDTDAPIAHIALAWAGGVDVREVNLAGDPTIATAQLTKGALNLLRLHLRGDNRNVS